MTAAINAAGALLRYLQDALCLPIHQIQTIHAFNAYVLRPYLCSTFAIQCIQQTFTQTLCYNDSYGEL